MSTINIKLRDLLSKEEIENFNTLTNKILCCGNDAIVLEVEEDILKEAGAIIDYIRDIHTDYGNDGNKTLYVTKIIKLKKREENDANCRILSQALTRIRELCGTKFVLENEDVIHIIEIINGAKSAIKQTRD
nr:MAG TPA: hypothetical protein [Caudoviricetes sp.]